MTESPPADSAGVFEKLLPWATMACLLTSRRRLKNQSLQSRF
jgi:hypothetical protein